MKKQDRYTVKYGACIQSIITEGGFCVGGIYLPVRVKGETVSIFVIMKFLDITGKRKENNENLKESFHLWRVAHLSPYIEATEPPC